MSFKDISYLERWWPSCSAEQNYLCDFGKGYYGEHSCKIILNLNQRFRKRCRLRIFFSENSILAQTGFFPLVE